MLASNGSPDQNWYGWKLFQLVHWSEFQVPCSMPPLARIGIAFGFLAGRADATFSSTFFRVAIFLVTCAGGLGLGLAISLRTNRRGLLLRVAGGAFILGVLPLVPVGAGLDVTCSTTVSTSTARLCVAGA